MKLENILQKHFKELLTEDANTEIQVMFETLVESKVAEKVSLLKEEKLKQLERKCARDLKSYKKELIENLNDYIKISVDDFLLENEGVITNNFIGMTSEKIMKGVQGLLKECHMSVPKAKRSVVADLQDSIEELKESLNKETKARINSERQINEYEKALAFQKMTENLTDSDKEKVLTLVESAKIESVKDMRKTVSILVENMDLIDRSNNDFLTEDLDRNFEKHSDKKSSKEESFDIDKYLPSYA